MENQPELKKSGTIKGVPADFLRKEQESLLRRNRQVIYLNDKEMAAITEYCSRFKVEVKTVLFRQAIMEKVMKELGESNPTLF